jgi:Zn-dependent peptidase ImmA (M78 family)
VTQLSRSEVEQKAADFLANYRIKSAPVPVEEVAEKHGFRIIRRYFDDDNLSGTVIRDSEGGVTIGINSLQVPVRQRFSIAHEVGHALMHLAAGEDLIVDPPARGFFNRDELASLGEDSNEIEANQFAASLLMPASFVKREGKRVWSASPDVDSLTQALAKTFEVSVQAMKFRLVNLGVVEPG